MHLRACTLTEPGQYVTSVEIEKAVLIRPDLMHKDMIETGIRIALDGADMAFRVRSAGNFLDEIVLTDHCGGLLELSRGSELCRKWAFQSRYRPALQRQLARFFFVFGPAHADFGVARLARSA